MAVGRGSILRAADTANETEKQLSKEAVVEESVVNSIHEEKFKVITSLKEELPIYLL